MIAHFILNAPPFSINKAYYKRSFTRTTECREWGDDILSQLQKNDIQAQLGTLRRVYEENPRLTCAISIIFHIPANKFYTKKGFVSRRSQDLSNVEKLLIDLIFDPRFNGRTVNDKVVFNLSMDDKLITKLVSEKAPTDGEYQIDVKIELISA